MGLNSKNAEVERLAAGVARLTGETKTEAVRRALLERRDRLSIGRSPQHSKRERLAAMLRRHWATLPEEVRGRPLSKAERERILGYGPEGA